MATDDVPSDDAGLASGLCSTAQELGGALGIAILTTIAKPRPRKHRRRHGPSRAQVEGLQTAFLVAAGLAVVALVVTRVALPKASRQSTT